MAHVEVDRDALAAFCHHYLVKRLSLFGSVLRDDFGPESDVDVLIEFDEDSRATLFTMARMERELEEILGRRVDLCTEGGLRHRIRHRVLDSAEVVYGT